MANSEVYSSVPSVFIEGFTLTDIQGTNAFLAESPFKDGHISQFAIVSINNPGNGKVEDKPDLRRISTLHGRSYEFVTGKENRIIWADEFGNIFTALNTKGNNCSTSEVCKSSTAPSGFVLYGLQESDAMVRVLRASSILRSGKIDTEAIVRVIEPAELPYNEKPIPLADFKKKLVEAVWEENVALGQKSDKTGFELATRQDIPQLAVALDKMIFFITVRGTQVNERLADLDKASNYMEVLAMLRPAFHYVNMTEKLKAEKDPSYTPWYFSLEKPEDIIRYFNEYLPRRAAQNFSRMHKLGLVHHFPHTANISTVASLYDLDSIRGEPLGLGDEPIKLQDMVADIRLFLNRDNGFPSPDQIIEKIIGKQETSFRENFIRQYFQEMGWEEDNIIYFDTISEIFADFRDDKYSSQVDHHIQKVVDRLGIHYDIDPNELLDFIVEEIDSWDDDTKKNMNALQIVGLFVKTVEDIIKVEIDRRYRQIDPESDITRRESVRIFSKQFAIREAVKTLDSLGFLLEEGETVARLAIINPADVAENYSFRVYQKLFKHWGWEQNIAQYADFIDYLFDSFESPVSHPYLEYYLSILPQQLGWNFILEETTEEMIDKFHMSDQEAAKRCVEKALRDLPEGKELDTVIHDVLVSNETGENFTYDHYSRYISFVLYYNEEKFETLYATEFKELQERYGVVCAAAISAWFQQRYDNKFVNNLPDDVEEELKKVSEERIKQLKEEFKSYGRKS